MYSLGLTARAVVLGKVRQLLYVAYSEAGPASRIFLPCRLALYRCVRSARFKESSRNPGVAFLKRIGISPD